MMTHEEDEVDTPHALLFPRPDDDFQFLWRMKNLLWSGHRKLVRRPGPFVLLLKAYANNWQVFHAGTPSLAPLLTRKTARPWRILDQTSAKKE